MPLRQRAPRLPHLAEKALQHAVPPHKNDTARLAAGVGLAEESPAPPVDALLAGLALAVGGCDPIPLGLVTKGRAERGVAVLRVDGSVHLDALPKFPEIAGLPFLRGSSL